VFQPIGRGMTDAMATADALAAFMERAEFGTPPQIVRTQDFSAYDDVAADETGNFTVLMCSVPFDFYYNG
jgi:hypothetical protein